MADDKPERVKRATLGSVARRRQTLDDDTFGPPVNPGSQEPDSNPGTRVPSKNPGSYEQPGFSASQVPPIHPGSEPNGRPITRAARRLKKQTYTLPLSLIEEVDKTQAAFAFATDVPDLQRKVEKSQIVAAAIRLGLADPDALRRQLFGDFDPPLDN